MAMMTAVPGVADSLLSQLNASVHCSMTGLLLCRNLQSQRRLARPVQKESLQMQSKTSHSLHPKRRSQHSRRRPLLHPQSRRARRLPSLLPQRCAGVRPSKQSPLTFPPSCCFQPTALIWQRACHLAESIQSPIQTCNGTQTAN